MNRRLELVNKSVRRVLDEYSSDGICPCDRPQFIYWVGKEQGPGWQDTLQNILVRQTLDLEFFEKTEIQKKEYWYSGSYFCGRCGTMWHHYSMEWRMLAFHERLLKEGEKDPGSLFPGMISEDIAATVGFEPPPDRIISLDQWVDFMLDPTPEEKDGGQ